MLRAIVEDYVATEEPVGLARPSSSGTTSGCPRRRSATTWRRWRRRATSPSPTPAPGGSRPTRATGCSSTSSRTVKPLSAAERRAIQTFLDGAVDLDDVVARTVRLLAQLTRQVAVVQYPSLTRSTVRHVELVPLTPAAADARADHRHRPGRAAGGRAARHRSSEAAVADLRARLNAASHGRRLADVAGARRGPARGVRAGRPRRPSPRCVATLLETLVERHEERSCWPARPTSTRFGHDFPLSVRAGAGGAGGAGGAAPAARRGGRGPRGRDGAHRPREPGRGAASDLGGLRRLRLGRRGASPGSAWSARPGWTTPARWARCAQWRATSAGPGRQ